MSWAMASGFLCVVWHPYKLKIYSIIPSGCGSGMPKVMQNNKSVTSQYWAEVWRWFFAGGLENINMAIWFTLFIGVWSSTYGHAKSDSQYWIENISRLNRAKMLIFFAYRYTYTTKTKLWSRSSLNQSYCLFPQHKITSE